MHRLLHFVPKYVMNTPFSCCITNCDIETCPVSFFETRERIYLDVSVTIDLISDALSETPIYELFS